MENLKKVVGFVVELANIGDSVGRSKNWTDLGNILDEALALPGVDFAALVDEAANVDMPEMVKFVADKLDLEDDALEAKVEATIAVVGNLGATVLLWARK